ncbi:MAG: tRNA dihydrouridine(20/20a) synthase DusA [Pseudomonadota bacterium]
MNTKAQTYHRFSVAPMMEWTDRHCRVLHRIFTKKSLLYTEMVVSKAIIRGLRNKLLGFNEQEHPVCLQIGGSEPDELAEAAKIAQEYGYDEINLNVGCPSKRVRSGAFGACLMMEPELVGDCLQAMREAVTIPVTIKHRIGVDGQNPRETLLPFVEYLASRGTDTFIIHARKAILKGLTPKENRDIPPLDYPLVHAIKAELPHLNIILNGGIHTLEQGRREMGDLDGIMLGRAAYRYPDILGQVDNMFFGADKVVTPFEAFAAYRPYVVEQLAKKVPLHAMTKHMLGMFKGHKGASAFRRILGEKTIPRETGIEVYDRAMEAIEAEMVGV